MGGDLDLHKEIRRGANLIISILKTVAGRSVRHLGTGMATSRTAEIHNCRQQDTGDINIRKTACSDGVTTTP